MVRQVITSGYEFCVPREAPLADGVEITPGMLIEINADGEAIPFAGGSGKVRVAYNDDFMTKDDTYDHSGDERSTTRVKYVTPPSGVTAELLVGENATLNAGGEVYANADGTVGSDSGAGANMVVGEVDGREETSIVTGALEQDRVMVDISN